MVARSARAEVHSPRAARARSGALAALSLAMSVGCSIGVEPRVMPDEDVRIIPLGDGGAGPSCRGNNDGVITRDEVVFVPGVEVRYRTNPTGTAAVVSPRGEPQPDGSQRWDFSDQTGDLVTLSLASIEGQWFAGDFAEAQYAAPLDPRQPVLGIYRATATTVELLGLASAQQETGTRVRYDRAIPVLRFPLSMGTAWTADAMVADGMVENVPIASRDHYDIAVDAQGEVRLGVITFRRALRLRIESTQMFPAGPGARRIQYLWLAECYGEVARMTSRDGEVDLDFTEAVEFRRLGL